MPSPEPLAGGFERRREERRRRSSFRLHERRTGFDRRERRPAGPLRSRYHALLLRLREDVRLLALVLVAINLFSLADLGLTLIALSRGAQEANPVLRPLFDFSPYAAAAFKAIMVLGVSLLVWDGRRYRRLLATGVLVMALFALVVIYQLGGLLFLT